MRATAYLEALPSYLKERGVDVRRLARSLKCSIGDIEALSVAEHKQARFSVFLEVLRTLGDELEGIEDATGTGVLEHIERARVRSEMSVTDVTRIAGLGRTYYSELMRNPNRRPRLHTMLRLAAAVDCELTVRSRHSTHQPGAPHHIPIDHAPPPSSPSSSSGSQPTVHHFGATREGAHTTDSPRVDVPRPPPSSAEPTAAPRSPDPPPGIAGASPPTAPRPEYDADVPRPSFRRWRPFYGGEDEINDNWMNDDPDLAADAEAMAAQIFGRGQATSSPRGPGDSGSPVLPPTDPSSAAASAEAMAALIFGRGQATSSPRGPGVSGSQAPSPTDPASAAAGAKAAPIFGRGQATSSPRGPGVIGSQAPPPTNPSAVDPMPPSDPRRGALKFQEMLDARINGTQVSAPTGAFTFHVSYEKFAVPPLNLPVDGTGRDTLECSTRLVPDPSEPPKKR